MILRLLSALALTATALLVPTSPAASAPLAVTITEDSQFSPSLVTGRLGKAVAWTNEDSVSHTATSDQGLWDTETIAPGAEKTLSFSSAGTFAYTCSFHPSMHGRVAIRMATKERTQSDGRAWTIRWAMGAAAEGRDYDVQYRRKTATRWRTFEKDVTFSSTGFKPRRAGTYTFRARTSNNVDEVSSAWSPVSTVRIAK